MVANYVDGVDLNCGCPQHWAKADGYGCYLLQKTNVIEDMMKTVRRNTPSDFSVSIKIRLLNKENISRTVDLTRKLEKLGITFITVHGRTPYEKSSGDFPVDANAIKEIKQSLHIPVIFNGDVTSLEDAEKFYNITKCDGEP
jgi:tRNA-dihydrouridine synthase 4